MIRYFFIILILSFYSCSKTDDDNENICTSNCTIIKEKFITTNNVGIQGVKGQLQYRYSDGGLLGESFTKLVANAQTDENGNFEVEFYIQDDELGNANGHFTTYYESINLDSTKYIFSNNNFAVAMQTKYSISNRDTIIGNTYYIPKKTYIKVNLNNFSPLKDDDYFEVITLYPFGPNIGANNFLDSEYSTGSSGWGAFKANGVNSQLNPYVAENERNIIRIARRKNGINSIEDFPIFVPTNNTIELSYDY
ncbi:hypothetical protein [Polaribacter uvawellassae]|uniref:hypothetical protein n=1 Tax=Polaribacter uvawellassae TaxID=3133495 RepID=UPI00321B88F4